MCTQYGYLLAKTLVDFPEQYGDDFFFPFFYGSAYA